MIWIRAKYCSENPFMPRPAVAHSNWIEVADDYDKQVYEQFAKEKCPPRMVFVKLEESQIQPESVT